MLLSYVAGWMRRWRDSVWADRGRWATGVAVFVLAALAFRLARSAAGYWEIDDAGITDAAAFELADHHSLAPFLGGPPIESYSNPLLFFITALLHVLGRFDPVATHVTLEMLVFAIMAVLVWSALRDWIGDLGAAAAVAVFVVLELLVPATWIWYGSGLENVWVAAGLVLLLWICLRTARGVPFHPAWGNAAFLVAITRPEGPVYVAGFYAVLLLLARPPQKTFRAHGLDVARAVVVTGALYVAFLGWRYLAYRSLLPNTYYAKLAGQSDPAANIHDYVVGALLPYCRTGLLAGSACLFLMVRRFETLAHCLLAIAVVALALPIAAGADFMGEHRFGTPFIAIAHLSYAAVLGALIARLVKRRRRVRLAQITVVLAAVVPAVLIGFDHLALVDDIPLSKVTLPHVAELNGGLRWEHQMRLGAPNAVVMTPDVGGALLVGAMQLVDNGYLADFQTPRIGRDPNSPLDRALLDQYELVERVPDLIDDNPYFPTDKDAVWARYAAGGGRFAARRDLVELDAVPPGARLLYSDDSLKVFLSPSTVAVAGPGGLLRLEVIVAWSGVSLDNSTRILADIDGDHDEIGLQPYVPASSGVERRALLLGMPEHAGSYSATLTIVRGHTTIQAAPASVEVTRDPNALERAARVLTDGTVPLEGARRIAWLREQAIPRLSERKLYATLKTLDDLDLAHAAKAGRYVMRLRWNARLADLETRSPPIASAERAAMRRLFDACPRAAAPNRALCLGRSSDELRRLGYLDADQPYVTAELAQVRRQLDALSPADRYEALVGLVLADPSDLALQRALLVARVGVVESGLSFPNVR